MPGRIEPPPSKRRTLYPDADAEALAWVAEKARSVVDHGPGRAAGWEWLAPDDGEPDPEDDGPVARVFDTDGDTVVMVTEAD